MTGISKEARITLAVRSGGFCEICYVAPATNWHHRKNRSQGGRNELSNAMHLCGSGTTGCHGRVTENPAEAYQFGWSVRSGQNPAEVPIWMHWRWLYLKDDGTAVER